MAQKTQKNSLKQSRNGLEQAIILLIQNQAAFQSQITATNARMDERFGRIERELAEIKAILAGHGDMLRNHERILQALPDAIRRKIGFKARQ